MRTKVRAMNSTGALATVPTGALATAEVPLDQLAGRWLASLTSPATRAAYRADFMAWLGFLAEHGLDALGADRGTVDAWRLTMETEPSPATGRPLSPATIARRLSTLRSFYDYTEDLGLIGRNPAAKAKAPRSSSESPTLGLDRGQALAFLNAAKADGQLTYTLSVTLLFLGLRVSEALALDVSDLQRERGHSVARVHGKGGKLGTVAVPPLVAEVLAEWLDGRTSGPVFLTASGERLDRHAAAYRVSKAARKAGVPGRITPHSLRHSAATLSLESGMPLHKVQDFLRHADPKTTRGYDRARQALDGHAAYGLAAYLAG
jgi:integrase/recombinase XerD